MSTLPKTRIAGWFVVPLALAFLTLTGLPSSAVVSDEPPPKPPPPPPMPLGGVEVKTPPVEAQLRGPIHEGFAEAVQLNPQPGEVVSKPPPPAIPETPPDQKPEGEDVAWMPGYWGWDSERGDYIWVSGFWRRLPPGRQWVAGYWNQRGDGSYQWVSGYWAPAKAAQVEYLPTPPPSLEVGPNIEAPSQEHIWTPGVWIYQDGNYTWRPGYWIENQPGWIYTPASYCWTPAGCVFNDGFWDYSFRRRGVLFAPYAFDDPWLASSWFNIGWNNWSGFGFGLGWGRGWGWGRGGWGWGSFGGWGGWGFTPRVCLDLDVLPNYMFFRRNCGTYFFGNYYSARCQAAGFRPWFNAGGAGVHCPIYNYYSAFHRVNNPGWNGAIRNDFQARMANPGLRPPTTFTQQQLAAGNLGRGLAQPPRYLRDSQALASQRPMSVTLPQLTRQTARPDAAQRLAAVPTAQRQQLATQARAAQLSAATRQQIDRQAAQLRTGQSPMPTSALRSAAPSLTAAPAATGVAPGAVAAARHAPIRMNQPSSGLTSRTPVTPAPSIRITEPGGRSMNDRLSGTLPPWPPRPVTPAGLRGTGSNVPAGITPSGGSGITVRSPNPGSASPARPSSPPALPGRTTYTPPATAGQIRGSGIATSPAAPAPAVGSYRPAMPSAPAAPSRAGMASPPVMGGMPRGYSGSPSIGGMPRGYSGPPSIGGAPRGYSGTPSMGGAPRGGSFGGGAAPRGMPSGGGAGPRGK